MVWIGSVLATDWANAAFLLQECRQLLLTPPLSAAVMPHSSLLLCEHGLPSQSCEQILRWSFTTAAVAAVAVQCFFYAPERGRNPTLNAAFSPLSKRKVLLLLSWEFGRSIVLTGVFNCRTCAAYHCDTGQWIQRSLMAQYVMLQVGLQPAPNVLLPRCMECRRDLAMKILSVRPYVRPSVRLSHAWIVTKRYKDLSRFIYHTKKHLA